MYLPFLNMKRCPKCCRVRVLKEFYSGLVNSQSGYCKECQIEYAKMYLENQKESHLFDEQHKDGKRLHGLLYVMNGGKS